MEFDISLNETKVWGDTFLQAVSLNLHEDKMNKVVLDSNRGKCIKQEAALCVCSVWWDGFDTLNDCMNFFFECPVYSENRVILIRKLEIYIITMKLKLAGNLAPQQNI